MLIRMKERERLSLEGIRAFLSGSGDIGFKAAKRKELYEWTERTLCAQEYHVLGRADKGLVKQYIGKATGLSRAQVTRLIGQYAENGIIRDRQSRGRKFGTRYRAADIALLAEVDEAHETLSGPATKKLLHRGWHEYADARYENMADISASHIYNLRKRRAYRERRTAFEKTRPTPVSIGERRKPEPGGKPGYIRVDSVHQGDLDGKKGVYHINAVDEVTQWEVVAAVEHISEAWLQPRLEDMMAQFPFPILGFHTDNGSEYINKNVAAMLNKLNVEQTKSRPGHSSDNGLAETKNGGVVRKHMGYDHIASVHADSVNDFYAEYFNPYLNFHRPCGVPELKTDKRGKTKRVYKVYATPLEILLNLPEAGLKEGVTKQQLEKRAGAQSDTGAAMKMREAKRKLFHHIDDCADQRAA